ncbi:MULTISPECIES: hypothetical protein [Rhodomicrobium]|uniref:hypothetical protein n=1 Tax=Rhodomicrobium TaxID=1068 RepID=UPI000B4B3C2E|nr:MULTISPECIES: hypothetical protein [Rhodomicrobium]
MHLSFRDDDLRTLCNTQALLRAHFGECGAIVERRLLTLSQAKVLGEITARPPDRRRLEPRLGPCAASVCARDAGRIYFNACDLDGRDQRPFEEVDHIEIFAIGRNSL